MGLAQMLLSIYGVLSICLPWGSIKILLFLKCLAQINILGSITMPSMEKKIFFTIVDDFSRYT